MAPFRSKIRELQKNKSKSPHEKIGVNPIFLFPRFGLQLSNCLSRKRLYKSLLGWQQDIYEAGHNQSHPPRQWIFRQEWYSHRSNLFRPILLGIILAHPSQQSTDLLPTDKNSTISRKFTKHFVTSALSGSGVSATNLVERLSKSLKSGFVIYQFLMSDRGLGTFLVKCGFVAVFSPASLS